MRPGKEMEEQNRESDPLPGNDGSVGRGGRESGWGEASSRKGSLGSASVAALSSSRAGFDPCGRN